MRTLRASGWCGHGPGSRVPVGGPDLGRRPVPVGRPRPLVVQQDAPLLAAQIEVEPAERPEAAHCEPETGRQAPGRAPVDQQPGAVLEHGCGEIASIVAAPSLANADGAELASAAAPLHVICDHARLFAGVVPDPLLGARIRLHAERADHRSIIRAPRGCDCPLSASLTTAASASMNSGRALKDAVRRSSIPCSRAKAIASTSMS